MIITEPGLPIYQVQYRVNKRTVTGEEVGLWHEYAPDITMDTYLQYKKGDPESWQLIDTGRVKATPLQPLIDLCDYGPYGEGEFCEHCGFKKNLHPIGKDAIEAKKRRYNIYLQAFQDWWKKYSVVEYTDSERVIALDAWMAALTDDDGSLI